jgi:hypothetical protein
MVVWFLASGWSGGRKKVKGGYKYAGNLGGP